MTIGESAGVVRIAVLAVAIMGGCAATSVETPASRKAPSDPRSQAGAAQERPSTSDKRIGDGYYLTVCASCGRSLGLAGEAVRRVVDGREILFCCDSCRVAFERGGVDSFRALDAVMVRDQRAIYPIDASIVSGAPLGAHPVDFMWTNRLVRVADESERSAFLQDPERWVRVLDDAVIRHRSPHYDIRKCLIQGIEMEEGEIVDVVVANRLFRVCCGECASRIRRNPRSHTAIVDFAWARATSAN